MGGGQLKRLIVNSDTSRHLHPKMCRYMALKAVGISLDQLLSSGAEHQYASVFATLWGHCSCPSINEVQGACQHAFEGGTDPGKSTRARRGMVRMAAVMTTAHLRTARHTGLLAVRNAASERPSMRSCLRRAHK